VIKSIKLKSSLKIDSKNEMEYRECVADIICNPVVLSMKKYIQHRNISCFQHCINVSYNSYLICRYLGWDYHVAARGGLLHDLFLYDWHYTKPKNGLHGFTHPYKALENANKFFILNDKEKDTIEKHMWPLTIKLPKYKESIVVCFIDKYCAVMETLKIGRADSLYKRDEFAN